MEYLLDKKMFCDKCGKELEIKRHKKITPKMLKQSYFFFEFGYCKKCKFFRMFEDKKIKISNDVKEFIKTGKIEVVSYQKKKKNKIKRIKQKEFKGGYKEYIKSKCWERRKKEYYSTNKKKCVGCGETKYIHLHHIVYGNFGNEKDTNLACLCRKCHKIFHKHHKHNDRKGFEQFVKEMREYIKIKKDYQLNNY